MQRCSADVRANTDRIHRRGSVEPRVDRRPVSARGDRWSCAARRSGEKGRRRDHGLVVRTNGTFQVETNYDTKGDTRDNSSYKFSGTCFSAGTVVRMVWDGGGQTDLRLRGDTIVVNNQGTAFSYLRR
jgi:hypothetical protein